jgi:hypothetical protein
MEVKYKTKREGWGFFYFEEIWVTLLAPEYE